MRALFAPLYLWDRHETFEAIPALAAPELMARAPIDQARCLEQLDAELHRNGDADALVRGYVFVYGEGTATTELLQAAHAVAREHGVPLHIHAGYLPGVAEVYRSLTGTGQVTHLQELGVLDAGTVIVHANALDDAEEAALRTSGCQVVWCPAAFLSLGIATAVPFRMAARHRAGVAIALGADGTFDGPPAETMRAARFVSQSYADSLTPETLLEMQTLEAAAAAGMATELGSLEAGKRADIVIRNPAAAEAYPDNDPAHILAFNMGPGSVETVLVDGRIVLADGRSTRVDEARVYREVSGSVAERAGRLGIDPGPAWPVVGDA
jgi:5-methylthioadenosine/S-adenosylhomocysteine deaminase